MKLAVRLQIMDFSRKTWILAASAVLIIAGTGLFFGLRYYYDRKAPDFMKEYTLYVYPDTEAGAVLDSLAAGASARREGSLRRCARSIGLEEGLKPGKYEILPEHSAAYVMRRLVNGWQTPQNLTLSGTIRTREKLAAAISRQMMMDSAAVMNALHDEELLASFGFTPENVFAMFLPDTYQVYRCSAPYAFMKRMKREYGKFWNDTRKALAKNAGLTPYEVSILASIVEEETKIPEEMNRVAGLYINRLNKGMLLQADPTVKFAVGDFSLKRILNKHLETDSPYNTYKYPGLPPGPIRIPSKTALNAVLNFEKNNYLYMCAKEDFSGRHNFATTLSEHNRNANRYRNALNRLKIK